MKTTITCLLTGFTLCLLFAGMATGQTKETLKLKSKTMENNLVHYRNINVKHG